LFGALLFFVVGMLRFEPLCLSTQSVISLSVKRFARVLDGMPELMKNLVNRLISR
jgi:hypothetical protein